jgi:mRNA-degrading endonuclease RelE of RelBE toxin-antitoxin system
VKWRVLVRSSARKAVAKLSGEMQERFNILLDVLAEAGPSGPHKWTNYGKLKGRQDCYHCHLSRGHAYVVCWEARKHEVIVEVYYAGTHQNAPY